jgi:hypothetical protein
MTRIHIFSNFIYSFWFFGLPLLAFLAMLSVILKRKLCKGELPNSKHFLHITRKPPTGREKEEKGNEGR